MNRFIELWRGFAERLEGVGEWLAPLFLRIILAYEFFTAGYNKYVGENWFDGIADRIPFPLNLLSVDANWYLSMAGELVLSMALLFGLATRAAAFGLMIVTFVAIVTVHWPEQWSTLGELWKGYTISDDGYGNYELPLLFLIMLVPLVLRGAGKLSLDALIASRVDPGKPEPDAGVTAWGQAALALGLPIAWLMPVFGLSLAGLGVVLIGSRFFLRG